MLPAKILALSAHRIKNTETEFGGNRKVALKLSWCRGEHSKLLLQELHPSSGRSLGIRWRIKYKSCIRWGLTVRGQWRGTKVLWSCQKQSQAGVSNPVMESGSWVALQPSFWHLTWWRKCCEGEQRTAGARCSSCGVQFNSVQSLSCVRLFATPWIAAR